MHSRVVAMSFPAIVECKSSMTLTSGRSALAVLVYTLSPSRASAADDGGCSPTVVYESSAVAPLVLVISLARVPASSPFDHHCTRQHEEESGRGISSLAHSLPCLRSSRLLSHSNSVPLAPSSRTPAPSPSLPQSIQTSEQQVKVSDHRPHAAATQT